MKQTLNVSMIHAKHFRLNVSQPCAEIQIQLWKMEVFTMHPSQNVPCQCIVGSSEILAVVHSRWMDTNIWLAIVSSDEDELMRKAIPGKHAVVFEYDPLHSFILMNTVPV